MSSTQGAVVRGELPLAAVSRWANGAASKPRDKGEPASATPPRSAAIRRSHLLLRSNHATAALEAAEEALAYATTGRRDEMAFHAAMVQRATVLAHMGRHAEAIRSAQMARMLRSVWPGDHGRGELALGLAYAYAGDRRALDHLLDAERTARPAGGELWHQALIELAACLRDQGYLQWAEVYLARSAIAARHERAWFSVRFGRTSSARAWLHPPISRSERPFIRAVIAALRLRERRPAWQTAQTARVAFREAGLTHWRWGVEWMLISDPSWDLGSRRALLGALLEELSGAGATHWGFFEPSLTASALRAHGDTVDRLRSRDLLDVIRERLDTTRGPLAPAFAALRILNPEAVPVLMDHGVTFAELHALTTGLDMWLEAGVAHRRDLAARMGKREASVRSALHDIRDKLGIGSRRGMEPLVAWLSDRDLLAPSTTRRVIELLARH